MTECRFTMFTSAPGSDQVAGRDHDADRWNVRGRVLYFWRDNWCVASYLTDDVVYVRRNF